MKHFYHLIFVLQLITLHGNCQKQSYVQQGSCRLTNSVTVKVDTYFIQAAGQVDINVDLYNWFNTPLESQPAKNNDNMLFGVFDNVPAIFQIKNITEETPFVLIGRADLRTGIPGSQGTGAAYMSEYQGLSILLKHEDVCKQKNVTITFNGTGGTGSIQCDTNFTGNCSCYSGAITCANGGAQFRMPRLGPN